MKERRSIISLIVLPLLLYSLILLSSDSEISASTEMQNMGGSPPFKPNITPEFKPGELTVKIIKGINAAAASDLRLTVSAKFVRNLYLSPIEIWKVEEGKELEIAAKLSALPVIEYAEPNYRYYAFTTTPNDTSFGNQWGHIKMNSTSAWDISTGGSSMTIAIIDTGIDETHPDLSGKIVAGYDYVDDDGDPHDTHGHGTHCAGIAAAVTNNSAGVAGMDWKAKIMPVRVLGTDGTGWSSDITEGITYAYTHGADVISLSLGGTGTYSPMQTAINSAHSAGTIVIAAMGNDRISGNPTNYPAAYNNVFAVAATGPTDVYAPYSQYGSHCDICAPGGAMTIYHDTAGIYSTLPTYDVYLTTTFGYYKNYDYLHGTSMATPYVAGLAALIKAVNSSLTPDQIQNIMESSAADLGTAGWDQDYGHGRIDAYAALNSLGREDDLLGTWAGQGTYYRNSDTGAWAKMASPADKIEAGDLDNDDTDDLIGIWPTQGGVWSRHSGDGSWNLLSSTADWIGTGDMDGDGHEDFLGTWSAQGVYYRSSGRAEWFALAAPATKITAGDLDNDGTDDLIGIWPSQGGVWIKYSSSGAWDYLGSTADWLAVGDMNGDGRVDLLGSWSGQGVYYRDSKTSTWIMMATPATQLAAGDLDGDGTDDLIGIWPTQGGVWAKQSSGGSWTLLSSTADWIASGMMRTPGSTSLGMGGPFTTLMNGPKNAPFMLDHSASGPGGRNFRPFLEGILGPFYSRFQKARIPGPGESGFQFTRQQNIIPGMNRERHNR